MHKYICTQCSHDIEGFEPEYCYDRNGDNLCDACGSSLACNHNNTSWKVIKEPTCQSTGLEQKYCYDCDSWIGNTRVLQTVSHDFSKLGTPQYPDGTCNPGYRVDSCKYNCGTTSTVSLEPSRDHNWSKWSPSTWLHHTRTCSICGLSVEAECEKGPQLPSSSGCYERQCNICNHTWVHGHSFENNYNSY